MSSDQFSSTDFHFAGELIAKRAVDQAVIEGEREVALRTDGDGVVNDNGDLLDGADAEDRDLRLIDDRGGEDAAEAAEVGDGERAALDFVGLQLLGAGARCEIDDGALQAEHVLLIGVADHGNDESAFESYRDAQVDFVVVDDVGPVDGALTMGKVRRASTAARATNGRKVSDMP